MKFFINRYRHKALKSVCFIGLISLVMLTACSSGGDKPGEEPNPTPTPEPPTVTAISFKSGLADDKEDITRADGLETKVNSFKVWSYKNMSVDDKNTQTLTDDVFGDVQTVMPGYIVNWGANTALTTETNTNDWEYVGMGQDQTIKYWDWSAKAYRFFGFAPANASITVGGSSVSGNISFTLSADASTDANIAATPYFSHLWFSDGNITHYDGKAFAQPVVLEFLKPIAQVRILFTFVPELTANGVDRSSLSEISFKPTKIEGQPQQAIANQGTVTITYPLTSTDIKESWSSDASGYFNEINIDYYEANNNYTPSDNLATTYPNSPQKWYNVLPRSNQGSYTLSVIVVGGEPKTCVVPAEYMTWSPGYQYTYKFKITETGGVTLDAIQVGVNIWTVIDTKEHWVYNW